MHNIGHSIRMLDNTEWDNCTLIKAGESIKGGTQGYLKILKASGDKVRDPDEGW